jgi:uncharacterized membrane protein YcgQ (UPF0703/DUF1980 family)
MRYKKNNRQKTPLGEKFDNMDFPFEPTAWTQMEALLQDSPTQPKAGFGFTKRIISGLILGVMISLGSAVAFKKDSTVLSNRASFESPNKEAITVNYMDKSKSIDSVFSTKNSVKEAPDASIFTFKNNEKTKVNATSKSFQNNYKMLSYSPNLRRLITQRALLNNDKSTFKNTITFNKNDDNVDKNKALERKNEQNERLMNTILATNTALMDTTIKVIPPQYFQEKIGKNDTLEGFVINDNYRPINRLDILETELLPFYETTEELTAETGFDFAPYGWALDGMTSIKQPLWRGMKHHLYMGVGVVAEVKGLSIKYARRITPLFGLGIHYQQVDDSYELNKKYFELEGQFYLVSRRHFELALTASYGLQWGQSYLTTIHPENKNISAFGGGLEARYCLTEQWNLGLRLDARKEAGNILIQLGYRF